MPASVQISGGRDGGVWVHWFFVSTKWMNYVSFSGALLLHLRPCVPERVLSSERTTDQHTDAHKQTGRHKSQTLSCEGIRHKPVELSSWITVKCCVACVFGDTDRGWDSCWGPLVGWEEPSVWPGHASALLFHREPLSLELLPSSWCHSLSLRRPPELLG